ncbi:hypothetical protein, partial [Prevotellamassilia timonensis]|uniref:hypothetical protein n=1 Tax=Prevotellamassilia timonensis TaxID=1852370 RepID=UPI003078562C
LGLTRDLHPLDNAHAERTTRKSCIKLGFMHFAKAPQIHVQMYFIIKNIFSALQVIVQLIQHHLVIRQ